MSGLVLVDNGGANIASVSNAFARLGAKIAVSRDPDAIRGADRVVLPGVGAAGDGMRRLRDAGLDAVIRGLEQPVLGICLGMQLLYDRSEEHDTACLGVLPGAVARLPQDDAVRVPHMGWNRLGGVRDHAVLSGIGASDWFYFVHAYAAPVNGVTLACSSNGERFAAVAGDGNFVAVQFHPERSSDAGARVLRNFLAWDGCS